MKNFTIFRNYNKKDGDKLPDYKMTASLAEGEKLTEIGACWLKDGKPNAEGIIQKYFSCKLADAYVDHTKGTARKGFTLEMEGQTTKAENYQQTTAPEDDGSPF
jgi:uncharacterized protein (DUF736 family)